MNNCSFVGRVARDVESRKTQDGKTVANFSLAVDRQGRDAGALFVNVIVWERQAENCAQYLVKGQRCAVTGRLDIRQYEKDGATRYATEIIANNVEFLDKPKGDGQGDQQQSAPRQQQQTQQGGWGSSAPAQQQAGGWGSQQQTGGGWGSQQQPQQQQRQRQQSFDGPVDEEIPF